MDWSIFRKVDITCYIVEFDGMVSRVGVMTSSSVCCVSQKLVEIKLFLWVGHFFILIFIIKGAILLLIFTYINTIRSTPCFSLQAGAPEENKFHVVLIGGLYASQPIGRELLIRLARHLVVGYGRRNPSILSIMSKAVIHVMPGIDPSFHMTDNPICNLPNSLAEIGYQFLEPQNGTGEVADSLKSMMEKEGFDLALNIEGDGIYVRWDIVYSNYVI